MSDGKNADLLIAAIQLGIEVGPVILKEFQGGSITYDQAAARWAETTHQVDAAAANLRGAITDFRADAAANDSAVERR